MNGLFFVIDGIDGSGKNTTATLLEEKLKKEGYVASKISFPQYGSKSAGPVELYLEEKIAPVSSFDAYAASLFCAVDRAFARFEIEKKLAEGIVIANRYVSSNAGHQGSKIENTQERKTFLLWLYDIEYNKLRIPKPTKTILLLLPLEIAVKRKQAQRTEQHVKLDGLERDIEHLRQSAETYRWLAETYPEDFTVVETVRETKELTPEEVLEEVWQEVKNMIRLSYVREHRTF